MAARPIPARSGAFAHLQPGQRLKIINTHGTQVVGVWAFAGLLIESVQEAGFQFRYLSMCHTRTALSKLSMSTNDTLRDNIRQPMLTLVEDTSGGVHDMLFAACDKHRYEQLGVKGYHESCTENLQKQLHEALNSFSVTSVGSLNGAVASASQVIDRWAPDVLNVFMNVPVKAVEDGKGGGVSLAIPTCPKGGYVVLKAETECMVIMSACPMDLNTMYETRGAEFEVLMLDVENMNFLSNIVNF